MDIHGSVHLHELLFDREKKKPMQKKFSNIHLLAYNNFRQYEFKSGEKAFVFQMSNHWSSNEVQWLKSVGLINLVS